MGRWAFLKPNSPNPTSRNFCLGDKFNLLTDQSKSCGYKYKEQKLEPIQPPNALYLLLATGDYSVSK
jgi:hypothetical protein